MISDQESASALILAATIGRFRHAGCAVCRNTSSTSNGSHPYRPDPHAAFCSTTVQPRLPLRASPQIKRHTEDIFPIEYDCRFQCRHPAAAEQRPVLADKAVKLV